MRGILGLYQEAESPASGRQAPLAGYHRVRSLSGESVTESGKDSENRHPKFQSSVTPGLAVDTKDGDELEMKLTRVPSKELSRVCAVRQRPQGIRSETVSSFTEALGVGIP